MDQKIEEFLAAGPWAVVGASTDRAKYGNKVLRAYLQHAREPLYAVNPNVDEVEGVPCFANLVALPEAPRAVSIITPPDVTEVVVHDAIAAGAEHLWMQPGAESADAVAVAEHAGLAVVHGGPCLLVVLGYRE